MTLRVASLLSCIAVLSFVWPEIITAGWQHNPVISNKQIYSVAVMRDVITALAVYIQAECNFGAMLALSECLQGFAQTNASL